MTKVLSQVFLDKNLCGTVNWRSGQDVYPISCGGKSGQIVKIVQNKNYLTLAEVQVFGPAFVAKCVKGVCEVPKGALGFIKTGESVSSPNGQTTAVMQKDGNFVLYCNVGKSRVPTWASNTDKKPVKDGLVLQVRSICLSSPNI